MHAASSPPLLLPSLQFTTTVPTSVVINIMARLQKSQLAKVFLLVFFLILLFLTPFISTSMRSSYLYFLLNLLIIVLGAEAGFLTAISKPREEKKLASITVAPISDSSATTTSTDFNMQQVNPIVDQKPRFMTTVEKKKKVINARLQQGLKRCKSRPSLFFIGCGVAEESDEVEMKEEEVLVVKRSSSALGGDGELSKQELFMKAEVFIGNFYKQLKMQRENSWQKLHGLYHKAF